MSGDKQPTMGKGGARQGAGRPTNKQLDERAEGLTMRENELEEREAALEQREREIEAATQAAANAGPQARVSIDEHAAPKEFSPAAENSKAMRSPIEMGKKFPDITPYLQEHGNEKQLMWINDVNGDVQRWIDLGAEPVPLAQKNSRVFEGITDRQESKWVRVVGGDIAGQPFYVYLLMIGKEDYDRIKLEPVRARQELIKRSMAFGGDRSDYGDGPNLQTYAPNLPSGNRGYEEQRELVGGNQG